MKKVLILLAVLIVCGTASGEEAKVFTDEDLGGYSNKSMVSDDDIKRLEKQEQQRKEEIADKEYQKQIAEQKKKDDAEEKRIKGLQEEALRIEKERVRVMERHYDQIHTDNILLYNSRMRRR